MIAPVMVVLGVTFEVDKSAVIEQVLITMGEVTHFQP